MVACWLAACLRRQGLSGLEEYLSYRTIALLNCVSAARACQRPSEIVNKI